MEAHKLTLIIVTSFLVLCILIKLLWDNRLELSLLFNPIHWIKALYSWSIIGIVIITMLVTNYLASNYMKVLVYKNGVDDICVDDISREPCKENGLRKNFYIKNIYEHETARIKGERAISDLESITTENLSLAPEKAANAWIQSTPNRLPGTIQNPCKFYDVFCKISNKIKRHLNQWYLNKRYEKELQIKNKVQVMANTGEIEIENFSTETKKYVNKEISDSQETTAAGIKKGFLYWDTYQFVSTVILALVAFKTFLMVMGRVIYVRKSDQSEAANNTIAFSNSSPHQSDHIEVFSGQNNLSISNLSRADDFYINLFKNVSDTKEVFRVKQPFTLVFSRLLSRYLMKKVAVSDARNPSISISAARTYVAWELNAESNVIFDMKKLIGFSDTIKLKRHISFRLCTLVFGKVIYTKAIGPGYLIFEARGIATANENPESLLSVNYNRHIAFDMSTRFSLDVSLSPFDTLLTGVNVARCGSTGGVVDVCQEDRLRNMLGRYLRYFIIPF